MRIIIAALLFAFPAQASTCLPHDDFVVQLGTRYGEVVQLQAMSADGRLTEMLANPATGTWSALMTKPDGTACLVAAGDRYLAVKPGDPA